MKKKSNSKNILSEKEKKPPVNIPKNLKAKKLQPPKEPPKWVGEYRNLRDFEMKVVTLNSLHILADHILSEAYNNENCITAGDLYLDLGIPERTYYDWVSKYDFFRDAHNQAIRLIGRRREKNGLQRKFDAGLVNATMPMYDKVWREAAEFRASLQNKDKSESQGTITVVMSSFDDVFEEGDNK